jgi:pimeloyl-ACP methyl ester carboxylesterase
MEMGFVRANRVRLQYFTHGHGPEVILFVHGYQASGRVWRLVQEALDPERFRTIALNNRGAGDSDRGAREGDYSIESFATDLAAAVQALTLRDVSLVGHSLGGATATQFALVHQSWLRALVLVNPIPLDHRTGSVRLGTSEAGRSALAAAAAAERAGAPEDFLQALDADMARNPPERLTGGRKAMDTVRLREQLADLAVPVLVLGGDQDRLVGVESILEEFFALPAETRSLHIIHGAGHSPNIGAPKEVAAVLDRFITQTVFSREGSGPF